ncbi:MAG: BamA/TamA family outer membrane protein [Aquificaceae bacterium]|nr:BamA/TamA family outer membrane protein [Aquificaceae bacterium]MDW8423497.1 BamA/TamA family outer membrane protein [Aquificaceae bacterium]
MLLILLLFFPLTVLSQVFIISNYPLRKNNLEKVINMDNYKEIVQVIRSVEDVKDVYLMEEEDRIYIYIERYPIVRKVHIRGNRTVQKEEILSYLGLYDGMPLRAPEFDEKDVEERIKRLYRDRGFLDVSVGVTIKRDEEGYLELFIGVDEGSVYFTEGGVYKGSSYEPSLLDLKIGLVRGRVYKETFFSEGVFPLQDFYRKEGFWDSFVYYEGVEKLKLEKPFFRVLLPHDRTLGKRPLGILGSFFEGLSNLFNHPLYTMKAFAGKGYVARPIFQIIEGNRYQVSWEGAEFFKPYELIRFTGLEEKGVDPFSLEEAKQELVRAYHRKGFFDVQVEYKVEDYRINFTIQEGKRYTIVGNVLEGEFYDEDKLEALLDKRLKELSAEGYTLAEGKLEKEVMKNLREVKVKLEIEPGKRQILKDFVYKGDNRVIKGIFKKHRERLPTIFNTDLVESLNLDLQRYFLRAGFMEGDFDIQVDIQEDDKNLYYTYIYTVKEGPIYQLGETIYYGYERTKLRELSYMTEKAKNYSETINDKTLHNMLNSGIFTGVSIDTFLDKERKLVHRLVQISEDQRGIFDLSLGYNTEELLSLETFLGLKNLFGVGVTSGFRYRKTGKRELYDLSLQDGFLFSSRYWFKSNLFRSYEEHKSYELNSNGYNLQLGYRITTNASVGPVISLLKNRVDGQNYHLRKYGLFYIREFKDDPFSPQRLHYNSINLSLAEGDARYTKFDLSTFYVIPVKSGFRLSFKVAGGAVWGDAPIFEKFFLGGIRDLRGYSFEEIGQPKGGKYYGFGRLEFIFSLKGPFIGVLFGDAGAVGDKWSYLAKNIKGDLGMGFGVNTPLGPVRLDLAFPIERKWLDRHRIYLSVGYYY